MLDDPAILSFRPLPDRPGSGLSEKRPVSQSRAVAANATGCPPLLQQASNPQVQDSSRKSTPASTQSPEGNSWRPSNSVPADYSVAHVNPMNTSSVGRDTLAPTQKAPARDGDVSSKPRRRQRQHRSAKNNHENENVDLTPEQPRQPGKGKGWRVTPILQSTASFQPFTSLKKADQRRKKSSQDNGWASEDVTDVQEMGDFDFEESLAKFDKRTLFDQMRKNDQIDDADRLVSHNRKPAPKPGTAGGKNYHHTENVLDTPVPSGMVASKIITKEPQPVLQDFWNSEADDTRVGGTTGAGVGGGAGGGDRSSGRELGSRQGSRRGESKVSTARRSQSRKASAGTVGQGPTRVNSVAVSAIRNRREEPGNFGVRPG